MDEIYDDTVKGVGPIKRQDADEFNIGTEKIIEDLSKENQIGESVLVTELMVLHLTD